MTGFGNCFRCGAQTGRYDEDRHDWDCGCGLRESSTTTPDDGIPNKFKKLIRTGRWDWIEKSDAKGNPVKVGVVRKSTGETRWLP